jgi:hypothetical protein
MLELDAGERGPLLMGQLMLRLFSSDHCVALYFDLGVGNGHHGDRDESAAREIIADDFTADLR